jgi:hypothetical protein
MPEFPRYRGPKGHTRFVSPSAGVGEDDSASDVLDGVVDVAFGI